MMEAAKLQDVQARGIVVLVYLIGHFKDSQHGYGWKENAMLSEAIPVYPGAYHMVSDDLRQYLFMRATVSVSGSGCIDASQLVLAFMLMIIYSLFLVVMYS